MLVGKLSKSKSKNKKYQMIFYKDGKKVKTIQFGSRGMSDFLHHKDPERRQRYIHRHKSNEDWSNVMTAGTLSRYISWGKPTLKESIEDTEKRFNIKIVSNI
jgi:2,3-bisphosphoglycerate-independent phosphoglycerate mutase